MIRHGVRVHLPWKLEMGNHCWLGEGAWLLNLEQITLGSNVCVSQDAFLCTGSHDHRLPGFDYDNAPIVVGDGAWIAARAVVLRGSVVPPGSVVSANSVFRSSYLRLSDDIKASDSPTDTYGGPR